MPRERGGVEPLSDARQRARAFLLAGLGQTTGPEAWRDGIEGCFDAVFPPGDERRVFLERRLIGGDEDQGLFRDTEIGTVYVVGFDNYVKIGFTTRPLKSRIAGLQTGCPVNLTVYAQIKGSVSDERRLQARFAAFRSEREWFRREGALAAWVEEGCPV